MSTPSEVLRTKANRQVLLAFLVVLGVGLLFTGAALTAGADTAEPAQDEVEISFEHSNDLGLVPGEAQTYEVVIEGADDGIEAYEFDLNVEDTDIAEIAEVEEMAVGVAEDEDGLTNTEIVDDGAGINFEAALGDERLEGDGPITIAEVDVTFADDADVSGVGTWDVSFDIDADEAVASNPNEEGGFYTASAADDLTQEYAWIDVNDNGVPAAATPNSNGQLADVGGTGGVNVVDSQLLFAQIDNINANDDWIPYFDFTDSGSVNVVDAQNHFANIDELSP